MLQECRLLIADFRLPIADFSRTVWVSGLCNDRYA
jgi:hypothetical protein